MIKHLLFDLDQTLLDFTISEYKALYDALTSNGFEFTPELNSYYSEVNESLWKALERKEVTKPFLLVERFRRTIKWYEEKYGSLPENLPPIEDINAMYIDSMSKYGIYCEGAEEFIQNVIKLRPDLKIQIVTNGTTKTAYGRLKKSGLNKIIDKAFISDVIGVNKPDKQFFDYVLVYLEAKKDECIVIGDSLTSDIAGAKNAGIKSIWYTRGVEPTKEVEEKYSITYSARNYDELLKIICQL